MSPTKPVPDPEPEHPIADRPGHRLHPDHTLPEPEPPKPAQPKDKRQARDAAAVPATSLTTLLPSAAAIGDPSFMVRAVGTGFGPTSVIVFAGNEEPTNFVSPEELTTGVNMDVWHGPDPAIPVLIRTTGEAGVEETATVLFAFTEPRPVPLDEAHASQPIPLMDQITRV
jgi:hypothetical protein